MKKRFLLLPVFAAFVFSLASCDKKEANVKYVDAEGNEQTVVVKATDDSEQTSKALYAIAQAASSEEAEKKQKELTKFCLELSETFDAKLSDTDYAKVNLKLEAAAAEGAMSASAEADFDVNMSALSVLIGIKGAKGNAKANIYYDLATATNTSLPNIYFDYDVNYKLAALDAEQKLEGKYFVTNAEIMKTLQKYASSISSLIPSITEPTTPSTEPSAEDLEYMQNLIKQFNLETEEDFKTFVENCGITISAVSANEIEFACDFKYDESKPNLRRFLAANPAIASQALVKEVINGASIPFKLAINTEYFLPTRFEIDYSAIATASFNTSMTDTAEAQAANPYANATATAKLSVKINYNGGTVKKLDDTSKYEEFKLSSIPFPTSAK